MAGTLSAFFDESGQEMKFEPDTKHYLLTIVLHDQGSPIAEEIAKYESLLSESSLPDVPPCLEPNVGDSQGEQLAYPGRGGVHGEHERKIAPSGPRGRVRCRHEFLRRLLREPFNLSARALELIDRASPLIPQLQRRVSPRRVPEELPQRRETHVARGGRVATHVAKPAHPALQAALGEALPREAGRGDALRLADDGAPLHRPVEVLYASPL